MNKKKNLKNQLIVIYVNRNSLMEMMNIIKLKMKRKVKIK